MEQSHKLARFCFTILICAGWIHAIGQNEEIDKLRAQLDQTSDNRKRIDILNQLGYEYYQIDISKTFQYSEAALEEGRAIGYQKGIAQALRHFAIGYRVRKNIPKSLELNQACLKIARQIQEPRLIANALNGLGIAHEALGLSEKAASYYLESLDYSLEENNERMICFTYRNLGFLYDHLGNSQKAIEYFNRGAEVAKHSEHHMIRYISDMNQGVNARRNQAYPEALEHLDKSYGLCTNYYSKATVLQEISRTYEEMGEREQAREFFLQALEIVEKSGNIEHLENSRLALASLLFRQADFQGCMTTLEDIRKSKKTTTSYSFNDKEIYSLLAKTHRQLQNNHKAAYYFEQFAIVQDSLYDRNKSDLVAGLEAKYQFAEKEKENAYLRSRQQQSDIILAQRKKATLYAILLAALLAIVVVLILKAYRDNQRFNRMLQRQVDAKTESLLVANDRLKASNIELERFAFIASHDLKEPLRNVFSFSGLLERRLKHIEQDPQVEEYLAYIKTSIRQMDELIRDVLEYSRLEGPNLSAYRDTSLDALVGRVEEAVRTEIKEQNIRIEIVTSSPVLSTIPSQLFLVLKNLVSNGVKYNDSNPKIIRLGYSDEGAFHRICVADNGIGIEKPYRDQIFEMFKRLHSRQEFHGNGLGLAICRKIVTNLGGKIWCESSGHGSQFYFTLAKRPGQQQRNSADAASSAVFSLSSE